MRYAILKGAGHSAVSLAAVMLQIHDTLDVTVCEETFFHNEGKPLTPEQATSVIDSLVALPRDVLIFGWNFTGYEFRQLVSIRKNDFYHLVLESTCDVFKMLQIMFNHMVSFYQLRLLVAEDCHQVTFYNAQTIGLMVKEIPYFLDTGNMSYVETFLRDYLDTFKTLLEFWYNAESVTLSFTTKQGLVQVELGNMLETAEAHTFHMTAISSLPKHVLADSFR